MVDDLGVGGFAIVVITQTSPEAEHFRGEGRLIEEPPADIHLMDALVAEVAIAGAPDPMPVVVQLAAAQGVFFGGAAPEIVVHIGRQGLGSAGFAYAGAALIAEPPRYGDLSQIALRYPFHGFGYTLAAAAALGAGLHDALVLAGCLDELASFPNVMRHWLFQIHITSALDRPNSTQGMPVVRGGDRYGVDVLGFQQLADVPVAFHIAAGFFAHLCYLPVENFLIDIAQRDEPRALHAGKGADVAATASSEADHGNADVRVGPGHL